MQLTGDTRFEVQLTWRDDHLHLWAIDRDSGSVAKLNALIRVAESTFGRFLTIVALPSSVTLDLPLTDTPTEVTTLRLKLAAIRDLSLRNASPTVQWFASAAALADRVLDAERVRPEIVASPPVYTARWRPIADATLAQHLAELRDAMPPAAGVDDIASLFVRLVDALARDRLSSTGWRPRPPFNARGVDYRAAQSTFRALCSDTGSVLYRSGDELAVAALQRTFEYEYERSTGMPVLCPQLRLHLPDDPEAPWRFTLELSDLDHPERWCRAADVEDENALALDLARLPEHLPRLRARLTEAGRQLAEHVRLLESLDGEPAGDVEVDTDDVESFLETAPPVLDALGVRLLGPEQLVRARASMRATATPRPDAPANRFGATALVQWSPTIEGDTVDEAILARAAVTGNSLIHVNGRWVQIDAAALRSTLERLQKRRDDDAELDISAVLRMAAEGLLAPDDPDATDVQGDGWIAELLDGLPDERLSELHESAGFTGELRHYQRRGLSWLGFLSRVGLGGCLADDMGLGKTATTLAHLVDRPGPHLVVCPLSVVHNWFTEAGRFTPTLKVAIHHGTERARGDDAAEQLIPADIVVTTYGLLARDLHALTGVTWSTVVLDEAQAIKNHLTKAAKAVRQLRATQKIALTGTPVENHLGELWSILDAVNPGLYGSHARFTHRYAKPIQRGPDSAEGVAATAALKSLTQPFILRRTKADKTLLPELPDKIEQIAWATLTKEQAAMYQGVVDQLLLAAQNERGMRRRGLVLAALTRLKQICNHPAHAAADGSRIAGRSGKLSRFDEIIDDLLAAGEQALVFTQFRQMGLILQRHLRERLAMDAPFLHGGVNRTGRDAMVRRFQERASAPLLLVSLKAGGTGLNLTSASQVIHYDRWWNPAVEDQATDRAWRIGQDRTVLVHKLVCEGTLEERISQLIDDKRRLADAVLGTGEQWLSELSTDDLRALVTLDPGGSQ